MSELDMGHMAYLKAVADGDVEFVRMREATYRGSWKRRGGVGAYMMMVRKSDRLEEMLSSPHSVMDRGVDKTPGKYDVFEAIAVNSSGQDGSVLAEIRDLRRYLLLIEAEMSSRGEIIIYEATRPTVAEFEEILREPDAPVEVLSDGSTRKMTMGELDAASMRPEISEHAPDALDRITLAIDNIVEKELPDLGHGARHQTLRRRIIELALLVHHQEEVEAMLGRSCSNYGVGPLITQRVPERLSTLERGDEIEADFYRLKGQEWAVSSETARFVIAAVMHDLGAHARRVSSGELPPVVLPVVCAECGEVIKDRAAAMVQVTQIGTDSRETHWHPLCLIPSNGETTGPGTPEDGGHHERQVPRYPRSDETEPRDGMTKKPKWWNCVESYDEATATIYYNVDRRTTSMKRPTMLRRELNNKEHELTEPYYRGMYEWSTRGEGKFLLREEYLTAWGK